MRSTLLGRADLLRAWAQADAAPSSRLAAACGFRLKPQSVVVELEPEQAEQAGNPAISSPDPAPMKPVLQAPCMYTAKVTNVDRGASAASAPRTPVSRAELLPAGGPLATPPLVRNPQLWPALQRSLSRGVQGNLDLKALVERLSRGRTLTALTYQDARVLATPLVVVWDDAERLMPYEPDVAQILRLIDRLHGTDYDLYACHESFGGWSRWSRARRDRQQRLASPPRLAGGVVLLLSDLGALAASTWREEQWLRQVRAWRDQGASVVAWLPTAPGQVAAELSCRAQVHHLSLTDRLRPQRKGWRGSEQRARAHQQLRRCRDRLLTLAACALHMSATNLRGLRLLDPGLRGEPAAEGLAWSASEVGTSLQSRPLRPECAADYRRRFGELPPALQHDVIHALQDLHAGNGPTTPALEWLLWQCHASAAAQSAETSKQITAARELLLRLAEAGAENVPIEHLRDFASDVVQRLSRDRRWWQQHGDVGSALHRLTNSDRIPAGLEADHGLGPFSPGAVLRVYLAQRRNSLWLMPEGHVLPAGQRLTESFVTDELLIDTKQPAVDRRRFSAALAPLELNRPVWPSIVNVRRHRIEIHQVRRPVWAQEFGRDALGVYALSPPLGERQEKFYARIHQDNDGELSVNAYVRWTKASSVDDSVGFSSPLRIGFDADFGIFVNLGVGRAVQRFRWVAPGEYHMGSDDSERNRIESRHLVRCRFESPRHKVMLTRGYWIADTPCTQAFWRSMVGRSSSKFNNNSRRPVENVRWIEIRRALDILNATLPDSCIADLPTEAEWEYACRAGTKTPFNVGETLTGADARFSGCDSFGVATGDGHGTARVASYAPNPWGLFDMHGNVWEWCRDGQRVYAGPITDPVGPLGGGMRVARGGSWASQAFQARSAARLAFPLDYRSDSLGFRLVLRSPAGWS